MARRGGRLAFPRPPGDPGVTRLHQLEHRRHSLLEIREIMGSMKTLAYMETRKLARFLEAQHAVVRSIEQMAADLLSFHPEILPAVEETTPVFLLIGTERGFCGDFNHALVRHLQAALQDHHLPGEPRLIAVGRRLANLVEEDSRACTLIDGATVAEEVPPLLSRLVDELAGLQPGHGLVSLYCLAHGAEGGPRMQRLLPPFQSLSRGGPRYPHPPDLNLPPRDFLIELADHYLFAALHEILYSSLMAENQQRVAHLEGAMDHLDEKLSVLGRQCNALRQEEIIGEIEVILLSAPGLEEPAAGRGREVKGGDGE
ncbi:MAG: F0F1 ATP synthase subunit gamma [Gammaproteobacteria bacterium]|nr:MAG: F0F1 ATP synthase subunit gamma [Gammaproteobacteria bacterium]